MSGNGSFSPTRIHSVAGTAAATVTRDAPAKVYARLRPLQLGVIEKLAHPAYSVAQDGSLLLSIPNESGDQAVETASFRLNGRVFAEDVGTTTIFVEAIQPLIIQATEGISSLVVAYGSSGSGKSYSLFGTLEAPGLIPSALGDLFAHIASYDNKTSAFSKPQPTLAIAAAFPGVGKTQWKEGLPNGSSGSPPCGDPPVRSEFNIRMSYVEIRGEQVGDLFVACEGYSPGQRIPTVASKHGGRLADSGELEGLKEVDVETLEAAIALVTKASAFKKARDGILGASGAHSIFRLSVERALCFPRENLAAAERHPEEQGAKTHDGKEPYVKEEPKKCTRQNAMVLKAEVIFVEAGGVETLIALPTEGEDRFNRSLFFLTECLLRLAEAPSSLESFNWSSSAATTLLRRPLLSPGHLAVLITLDPSDRYVPVSLPVMNFASRLCNIKRHIEQQTIQPRKSRLFELHRLVLQQSELLLICLSALRKKTPCALRQRRASEWWAPTQEEQVRRVAHIQEAVRNLQAKILLSGSSDWSLLESSRLTRLIFLMKHLASNRDFLRYALETDVALRENVPHLSSPRPFSARRDPSPPSQKHVYLKTKEKPTTFMSMHDVAVQLKCAPSGKEQPHSDELLNLTGSLFCQQLSDLRGPRGSGGAPYPRGRGLSPAVRQLFAHEGIASSDASRSEQHFNGEAIHHEASIAQEPPRQHEGRAASAALPIAVARTPPTYSYDQQESVFESPLVAAHNGPELGWEEGAEAPPQVEDLDAAEHYANGDVDGAEYFASSEHAVNFLTPEGLQLQTDQPGWIDMREQMPHTPLAQEMIAAPDEQEEAEQRYYFSVEWKMRAAPPEETLGELKAKEDDSEKPPSITYKGVRNESGPLAISQAPLKTKKDVTMAAQDQIYPGDEQTGNPEESLAEDFEAKVLAESPPKNSEEGANRMSTEETSQEESQVGMRNSSIATSGSSSKGEKVENSFLSKPHFRLRISSKDKDEGNSKKLLEKASALRSEVLALINQSYSKESLEAPRSDPPTEKRGSVPRGGILRRGSSKESSTSESTRRRFSPDLKNHLKEKSSDIRGAPRPSSSQPEPQTRQHQKNGLEEPHGLCLKQCEPPPCTVCCVHHAHVPVSCVHAGVPYWGLPAQEGRLPSNDQGKEQPSSPMRTPTAWPQAVVLPPGVSWGPTVLASPMGEVPLYLQGASTEALKGSATKGDVAQGDSLLLLRRSPPQVPQLTPADRRLPRFKAAKGGASWEIPGPSPKGDATAAEAAPGECCTFCLPEEPENPRRAFDTKSDLLLQQTLRPWTRERRRRTVEGPKSMYKDVRSARGRYTGKQGKRAGAEGALSGPAERSSTAETISPVCCLPNWGLFQRLGRPARPPPRAFPTAARLLGASSRPPLPRSCWMRIKGKGVLCRKESDSESSSAGPPSATESSVTLRQAASPRVYQNSSAPAIGPSSPRGHPLETLETKLKSSPRKNPFLVVPNAVHRTPTAPAIQRQQEGHHHKEVQVSPATFPTLQQEKRHREIPPLSARMLSNTPDPSSGHRLPEIAGEPTAHLEGTPAGTATCSSPKRTSVQRPPLGAQPTNKQSVPRQSSIPANCSRNAAYLEGPYRGPQMQSAAPPSFRWVSRPSPFPAARRAFTPRDEYVSKAIPSLRQEGTPGTGVAVTALPNFWRPAETEQPPNCRLFCATDTCGGASAEPLASATPARIVNIVSRTRGGIPMDLELGREKCRTVYPPEKPLNIPADNPEARAPVEPGGLPYGGALDDTRPNTWTPQQAPHPMCCGEIPAALVPGQVWARPLFLPANTKETGVAWESTRPRTPAAYYANLPAMPWGPQINPGALKSPDKAVLTSPRNVSGTPGALRSSSVGPPQVRRDPSGSHSAAPLMGPVPSFTEGTPAVPSQGFRAGLGEEGEANCFEECLDFWNERVGRFYARRPKMGAKERHLSRGPPNKRATVTSGEETRCPSPATKGKKQCGPPYSCAISTAFGIGAQ
ncbi:uncharacterized protein LOC34619606 [Cyclospora cayetanensis]|uniref:Uncharacterized protein LOC34619606 n=1 Tax=Cyclospora cayetanensis TaxID=88456 RepID=A0A6P6RVV8_9EIME|nr:uncharacterized protein LOC34619606 [Cyclospora cayetanensis]